MSIGFRMAFPFPHEIRFSDIDSGAIIAEYRAVHQPQAPPPFGLGEEHAVILGLLEETQDMLLGDKREQLRKTRGRPRRDEEKPTDGRFSYGRNPAYLTARIARDHPDVLTRQEAGEFPSVLAAAKAAS